MASLRDTIGAVLSRRPQQPRRLVLAGLGVAVAGLALLNIMIAMRPVDVSPIAATKSSHLGTAQTGADKLRTPLDSKPPGSFAETTARPIFNAGRQPVERQQPAAAPVAGPEELRLMGVLQTASGTKRALIRAGAEAKGVWVVEGEEVSGWTLKSIGARSVIVASGGRSYEITINKSVGR